MTYTLADAGITTEAAPTRLWISLPVGSAAKTAVKRAGATGIRRRFAGGLGRRSPRMLALHSSVHFRALSPRTAARKRSRRARRSARATRS